MRMAPAVLAISLLTTSARAQTPDAEALIREGVEARRERRDADALRLFSRAHDLTHSPRALAQVGLAEQALGRWLEAEGHLRGALDRRDDPWIARNAAPLTTALGVVAQHLGWLRIDGGVAGAEVLVDGQPIGTLPTSVALRVVAGTLALEVRAPGHVTIRREVAIPPDGEAREVVRLTPDLSGSTVAVAVRSPEAVTAPSGASPDRVVPRPRSIRPMLAWGALAGAAVGAGVAIGAAVSREGHVAEYNADATCPGVRHGPQPPSCEALVGATDTMEQVFAVALVSAGVLAVTSVVLFLTGSNRSDGVTPTARFACDVGPGVVGIQCLGRFKEGDDR